MTNPNRVQKPVKSKDTQPEEQKYLYFTIAAEITYVDQVPREGEIPNYKREKANLLYVGELGGINGEELGKIHARFQINFQNDYATTLAKITKVVPEITKVVILNVSLLGQFTQEEFEARVSVPTAPKAEPRKKK